MLLVNATHRYHLPGIPTFATISHPFVGVAAFILGLYMTLYDPQYIHPPHTIAMHLILLAGRFLGDLSFHHLVIGDTRKYI